MKYIASCLTIAWVALLVAGGCNDRTATQPADPATGPVSTADVEIPAGMEDIATLSEADQRSAIAQRICPVSQQLLGSMGEPVKVTVNGREVWLCCAACEPQILEDPDRYLANLDTDR